MLPMAARRQMGSCAFRACGVSEAETGLQAARRWLEKSFRADAHPGGYAGDREVNREMLYYYYAFSVSRARRSDGDDQARRDRLAGALLKRQGADGSWANSAVALREDDPLVATNFALLCRPLAEMAAQPSSRRVWITDKLRHLSSATSLQPPVTLYQSCFLWIFRNFPDGKH